MALERKIFRGVSVVVVGVNGSDRKLKVSSWLSDTQPLDYAAPTFDIDLNKTPSRAPWTDVTCDDRGIKKDRTPLPAAQTVKDLTGYHVTSVGGFRAAQVPDELAKGMFVGAVYIEDKIFQGEELRKKIDHAVKWPTARYKSYELTTIHYLQIDSNRPWSGLRFAGFHGKIVKNAGNGMLKVEISQPGNAGKAMGTWWFDLNEPTECDPDAVFDAAAGEKKLTSASAAPDEGAIYVELAHVAALMMSGPKLPIGLGG